MHIINSVESIYKAYEWDKTEEGWNVQLFIINYLFYRDSNQITIYMDCNHIKGSLKYVYS